MEDVCSAQVQAQVISARQLRSKSTDSSARTFGGRRILVISEQLVRVAASEGACVIVGREAQYFLQGRADIYHVFLYSPYEEKIRREQNAGRSIVEANQFVKAEIPKVDLLWHMHCSPFFAFNKKEICA
jgi:hypothetical protein